jgi:UDP-glucose 4-epimerase
VSWLITGGAGYIGSHIAQTFVLEGEEVVVLDNLRSGLVERVPSGVPFYEGDITSEDVYEKIFSQEKIKGVINLAALKSVEESMRLPDEYRRVNTYGVETTLKMAIKYGVEIFLQTSTAAVYGNVEGGIAFESTKANPISVYGSTKLDAEEILSSYIQSGKIKGASLRYFNVVGASTPKLRDTSNSNLFPIAMNELRAHKAPSVFGNDYPTLDGSCIRDYVHVQDVADAHLLAVRALKTDSLPGALNIGTGKGLSVFEVLDAMQTHLGTQAEVKIRPRREGDPASLVANVDLAWKQLGFRAKRSLEEMVSTTYI